MRPVFWRRTWLGIFLISLTGVFCIFAFGHRLPSPPAVSRGVVDLSSWNFSLQGNVRLDGEWEFHPGSMMTPGEEESVPQYIQVPSSFNPEGKGFLSPRRSHGFGSYRIRVKIPQNGGRLALFVRPIYSAAEILVNGRSVYHAGSPGRSREETHPAFNPGMVILDETACGELEIVCRAANYSYYKGGMVTGILIGSAGTMSSYRDSSFFRLFFVLGVLFVTALYHLSLYALRTKETTSLFFGLACASFAIRILFSDMMPLSGYCSWIPWEAIVKVQYLSYYAAIAFFLLFFRGFLPEEMPGKFVAAAEGVILFFAAATAVLPAWIYSFFLSKPFELFGVIVMGCVLFFLIRAVRAGRKGVLFVLTGCIVLIVSVVNDVLYTSQIVDTGYFAMLGFMVFVFLQAFALAIKFTDSFYSVERLSEEIRESKEQLHKTVIRLSEKEKQATLNTLVAGIAHDVSSPLGISITASGYFESRTASFGAEISRGTATTKDVDAYLSDARESSAIISSNLKRAADLMRSFKDLVADQHNEECRVFNVKQYLGDIVLSLGPKLNRKGHSVVIHCPEDFFISSYPGAFAQIIINLILNSIIHGFEDMSQGVVTIDIADEQGRFSLRYHDNGRGIAPEHLSMLFEPFFTTKRGKGGTGLGMHIVNTTVQRTFNGSIRCESVLNEGTTFFIEFPLQ